jgi:hypothetical protein
MQLEGETDRRAPDSPPLRTGAMRCEACGTTWFDSLAYQYATGCRCRRCGGRLHHERRGAARFSTVNRAA